MTQVQLTDQELNRKLAELMGYSIKEYMHSCGLVSPYGSVIAESVTEDEAWEDAPDYCNNPAASLEIQAAACKVSPIQFIMNLQTQMWGLEYGGMPYYKIAQLLQATPRERAEAAYITISSKQ
jgi:hypothetical protein